ncbi:MAG: hypothetical protein KA586_03685 [Candidatus Promineofilum sp.]|nr:hypothetical protein [Promineifilum sp.]
MTEPTTPVEETGELPTIERSGNDERRPRMSVRLFGLALIIFSVVVATYLLVAYFAIESGQAERVEQETTSRATQIGRQVELARDDLAEGSDNLALTRLEWVLAQDPNNSEALALREQIAATAAAPTAAPTDPPAEPVEEPNTAEQLTDEDALPELRVIRRLAATEQWEDALSALLPFRQKHPDYQRAETDQLLYDTYVALGLQYVNSDKIELGLNYFSQAEQLGNLPQEALDYRVWADLYFQGVAYSGVNWEIAAEYWRDLCAAAPFFKGACDRLDEALEGHGDQLAYLFDYCPAVSIYQEAWNRRPSERLGGKLNAAREGCASATPVPITGTLPLTGTAPITGTSPAGPGG